MMRALTPKKQAELLSEFLNQSGVTPAHTQVLELVARLNGAPNWNALQKPVTRASENAFSKAVKAMLAPLAKQLKVEAELKEFRPAAEMPRPARVIHVRIPLMADSDSRFIADSIPCDGGHRAQVS